MNGHDRVLDDRTPGVEHEESAANVLSYTAGLGLAILAAASWHNEIRCGPRAYRPGWSCSPLRRSASTSSSFCIWAVGPITRTTFWPSFLAC